MNLINKIRLTNRYTFFFTIFLAVLLLVGLMSSIVQASPLGQTTDCCIIYVNAEATGTNTGDSWANAFTELQSALAVAEAGQEIWVAAGTYRPDYDPGSDSHTLDRSLYFTLKSGVSLYGGFAGTETSRLERDWRTNVTILSGDLLGNDGPDLTNNDENSYHVLEAIDVTDVMLDGFIVQGGKANGTGEGRARAGGLRTANSTITLSNMRFTANDAGGGGAMYLAASQITMDQVEFIKNNTSSGGGGMWITSSAAVTLTNSLLVENTARNFGGAIYNSSGSQVTVINTTIANNSVSSGGGIFNTNGGSGTDHSFSTVINSILWGNSGGQIVNFSASGSTNNDSIIQGISGGTVLNANPLFVDAANGDFRLQVTSPALNIGNNDVLPFGANLDLAGEPRVNNGTVDLGAYELVDAGSILYVDADAAGGNTGASWTDAFTELQSALAVATAGQEIWVAAGTYLPDYDPGSDTHTLDRSLYFNLKSGVSLYGGFVGIESSRLERDWRTNVTILSGDLLGNDGPNLANNDENSYHVLQGIDVTDVVLDGFTVQGGNANGTGVGQARAGGLRTANSTININNMRFTANDANGGGAMYLAASQITLDRVELIENNTSSGGGGMWITSSAAVTLTNSLLVENTARNFGGAIYNSSGSQVTVINTTIANNSVSSGGGIFNTNGGSGSDHSFSTVINSIFWGNSGGQIFNFPGSGSTNSYSLIQGVSGGTVFNANPLFVDPTNGDFRLQATSPALNVGDNEALPSYAMIDLAGVIRVQEKTVDLGAYERPVECLTPEPELGSITIIKSVGSPSTDHAFDFAGDLGEFALQHGQSYSMTNLSAGTYTVYENEATFPDNLWALLAVTCTYKNDLGEPISVIPERPDTTALVNIPLESGQDLTCIFLNERVNFEPSAPEQPLFLPMITVPVLED